MEFFFKASLIMSVLSAICLMLQEVGSNGFMLCLITLIIGVVISLLSGIFLRRGRVK